jgi:hypothetical protein
MIFEILDRHDWLGATLRAIGGHTYRKGSIANFRLATWKSVCLLPHMALLLWGRLGLRQMGKVAFFPLDKSRGYSDGTPAGLGKCVIL